MNLEEAIKNREDCLKYLEEIGPKASLDCLEAVRWSAKALKALRPVSREQVEKVWKGCQRCTAPEDEALDAGGAHDFRVLGDGLYYFDRAYGWEGENILFCPWCGRPLTDEAVEMMMERLEALYGKAD